MSASPNARRIRAACVLGAAALALSGCSLQSLSMSPNLSHSASHSSSHRAAPAEPSGSPSTSTSATSLRTSSGHTGTQVRGALASGSITHKIAAGAGALVITYWTTQNVATWTAGMRVPVQFAAHLEGGNPRDRAYLTDLRVTLSSGDTSAESVLRQDSGRFMLSSPYSYSSAIVLPPRADNAQRATANLEFDLVVETAPGSGQYVRQTVLDTLTFTYVQAA
jgi:hypothetical protein